MRFARDSKNCQARVGRLVLREAELKRSAKKRIKDRQKISGQLELDKKRVDVQLVRFA